MRALVICVALLGCRDREAAELDRIGDEVCNCQTSECAQKALAEVPQQDTHSSPKTQALARRMLDCIAKIRDKEEQQKAAAQPDEGSDSGSGSAGTGSGS